MDSVATSQYEGLRRRKIGNYDPSASAIDDVGVFKNPMQIRSKFSHDPPAESMEMEESQTMGIHTEEVELSEKKTVTFSGDADVDAEFVLAPLELKVAKPNESASNDSCPHGYTCTMPGRLGEFHPNLNKVRELASDTITAINRYNARLVVHEHWIDVVFRRISNGISLLNYLEQRIISVGNQRAGTSEPVFLDSLPQEAQPLVPLLLAKAYADLANSLEDTPRSEHATTEDGCLKVTKKIHDVLVESALTVLQLLDQDPSGGNEESDNVSDVKREVSQQEYMSILSLFTTLEQGSVIHDRDALPTSVPPKAEAETGGFLSYITDTLSKLSMFSNSGADEQTGDLEEEPEKGTIIQDSPFFTYLMESVNFFDRFSISDDSQLYGELVKCPPSKIVTQMSQKILDNTVAQIEMEIHVAHEHLNIVKHLQHKIGDALENVGEPLECLHNKYMELLARDLNLMD